MAPHRHSAAGGRQYGPPGRKRLIFFIDDMNMPTPDKYGTQDAIALLRMHFDYGFWYDRNKMTMKEIVNVQYFSAMNPKVWWRARPTGLRHVGRYAGVPRVIVVGCAGARSGMH